MWRRAWDGDGTLFIAGGRKIAREIGKKALRRVLGCGDARQSDKARTRLRERGFAAREDKVVLDKKVSPVGLLHAAQQA